MLRRLSIGPRLIVLLLAGAGAVLWAVVGYSARASRRILEAELEAKANAIAVATAARITDASQSVEKTVETLAPGETLLLYTDGITEAMDRAEEMSGPERTAACLSRSASLECDGVVQFIRKAVAEFSDGAPQSDDITILAFRYHGDRMVAGAAAS